MNGLGRRLGTERRTCSLGAGALLLASTALIVCAIGFAGAGWEASLGAGALGFLMVVGLVRGKVRQAEEIERIRWFPGLGKVLRDVRYPLSSDVLYPVGAWLAGLFPGHEGWVLLVRVPGLLIRGEVLRKRYLRVLSEDLRGEWSVSWAESFTRDWLEGQAGHGGVVVPLPGDDRQVRSLLCWMSQAEEEGLAIAIALPAGVRGARPPIPDVLNAALDMVVQRLGSLRAEVLHRRSRIHGQDPISRHDPLLLVRALVHELSTELQGTFNRLEALEEALGEAARQSVHDLLRSLTRAAYWSDLLRDVPMIRDDFPAFARSPVPLRGLLREVSEEVRPAWPDCTFVLGMEAEVVVIADHHLRLVVRNLFYNAASFSPPEGVVELRVRQDSEFARIFVDDEGPGVEPDQIEAIFDPYYTSPRAREPGPRIRQGAGIGLSVARMFARSYGGDLRCYSNDVAGGGRFELILPLAEEAESGDAPTGAA